VITSIAEASRTNSKVLALLVCFEVPGSLEMCFSRQIIAVTAKLHRHWAGQGQITVLVTMFYATNEGNVAVTFR